MRVLIQSGNQAGTIEEVSVTVAEILVGTGYAAYLPEPAPVARDPVFASDAIAAPVLAAHDPSADPTGQP